MIGAQGQHHDCILVGAEGGLALGRHGGDHLTGEVADPQTLAERVLAGEEFAADGGADDADGGAGAQFAVGEHAAVLQRPVLHSEPV